jgi:hypothetical protein
MVAVGDDQTTPLRPRQLAIELHNEVVRIEIRCASIYDAMMVYDTANATARDSSLQLPLKLREPSDA